MMTLKEMMMNDIIIEAGIATVDEINLVRCICSGTWEEIFNAIVYARTGYKTLKQYLDEEFRELEDEFD